MSEASDLYNVAEKLKDEGKYEEAIAKFLESAAANPQYALPHMALGIVYGKVNKHEEAVRHAHKACELEPEEALNYTTLSRVAVLAFTASNDEQFKILAEDAMARAQMLQQRR
ncbi:tetratricopeptide repeat protein [Lignipirellula cremea]|uniref:Tetratricopeptide repeat protein n=1 Tax=Lignipirellula cremea TaxID=2528010 RepID=A0A518E0W4_9BACT|nr:tetratricopeptide repeat protein [Lignipirellula cremea]QDU97729.1 Tetratricopeptide repeat protein [Lignipirellula cremea]